jgi:hypothetical protein
MFTWQSTQFSYRLREISGEHFLTEFVAFSLQPVDLVTYFYLYLIAHFEEWQQNIDSETQFDLLLQPLVFVLRYGLVLNYLKLSFSS